MKTKTVIGKKLYLAARMAKAAAGSNIVEDIDAVVSYLSTTTKAVEANPHPTPSLSSLKGFSYEDLWAYCKFKGCDSRGTKKELLLWLENETD